MSNPSSPELTVKFAATVLAVRATRARRCGGLVKTADWKEQVQTFAENLKDPGVNLQESFTGPDADLTGAKHWKSVGMEALRNAIIGAGVGGVGGAASSLLSRRRKKQPFHRALRGALVGGGLGAAGTAAYRGLEFPLSGIPTAAIEESGRKARIAEAQAGDPSLWKDMKQRANAVLDVRTPTEAGELVTGSPESTTFGFPAGAIAGGAGGAAVAAAPRGLHQLGRAAYNRRNLEEILKAPAAKDVGGMPEKLVRQPGVRRRLGLEQFKDVNKATARAGITAARKPSPIWGKKPGKLGLLSMIASTLAGTLAGSHYDQAKAREMYGQPPQSQQ